MTEDILSWSENDSVWESLKRLQAEALLIYFVIWSLSFKSVPGFESQGPMLLRIDDYLKTCPKIPNWLDFVFWKVGTENEQSKNELQKSLASALNTRNSVVDSENYHRNIRRWLKNKPFADTQSERALVTAFADLNWPVWVGEVQAQSTYEQFSMLAWTQNAIDLIQFYEEQYGQTRQFILNCSQVVEPILLSLPKEAEKVRAYAGPI